MYLRSALFFSSFLKWWLFIRSDPDPDPDSAGSGLFRGLVSVISSGSDPDPVNLHPGLLELGPVFSEWLDPVAI